MYITHQINTLNKKDGGPSRSVFNLCIEQSKKGHHVIILCCESDYDTETYPFKIIQLGSDFEVDTVKSVLLVSDIIHIHGIWLPSNHKTARFANKHSKPYVVHTRGLMQRWAMSNKWLKKKIAWLIYQRKDLINSAYIIATAEIEKNDILYYLPSAKIEIMPNCIEYQGNVKRQSFLSNISSKRAVFISRIHKKKGIHDLIKVWSKINPENWQLIIAGPDNDSIWTNLELIIPSTSKSINYIGYVDGQEKADLYRSADLFILPTYSENFGLVVPEALSVGTPVVTTTGTPWSNLPEIGCGWYIEPGMESLEKYLPGILSLTKEDYFNMGQKGALYVQETFSWERIAKQSIEIYEKAICSQQ